MNNVHGKRQADGTISDDDDNTVSSHKRIRTAHVRNEDDDDADSDDEVEELLEDGTDDQPGLERRQQARERLFYVNPGETPYVVSGKDQSSQQPKDDSAEASSEMPPSWGVNLWSSLTEASH